MPSNELSTADISPELLDAIAQFPIVREVSHCGASFEVSPFDLYAVCPMCSERVKVRSFAAIPEIEDVFEAVFTWLAQPGALEVARRRQNDMAADMD